MRMRILRMRMSKMRILKGGRKGDEEFSDMRVLKGLVRTDPNRDLNERQDVAQE